jgi:thymidine kinase
MALTLILGCMFSGKTTELMRMVEREISIGRNTVIINHSFDSQRGIEDTVKSHSGKIKECISSKELLTIPLLGDDYDTIAINEGQFFPDLVDFVLMALKMKKHVIVCGLDSDYRQLAFDNMLALVPHADTLIKTTALCSVCRDGTPAIYSMRIGGGKERVQIGGSESYKPVCRKCFRM